MRFLPKTAVNLRLDAAIWRRTLEIGRTIGRSGRWRGTDVGGEFSGAWHRKWPLKIQVVASAVAFTFTLAMSGCASSDATTAGASQTIDGVSKQNCIPWGRIDGSAHASIVDAAGKQLSVETTVTVDIGGNQTGTTIEHEFTISNNASFVSAFELGIESIALDYVPTSSAEKAATGDVAWQCWDETGTESCATHKWRTLVPYPMPFDDQDKQECVRAEKFRVRFKVFDASPRHSTLRLRFRNDPETGTQIIHFVAR